MTTTSAKHRLERLEQPPYVLVVAGADHADQPAEAERLADGRGGGAGAPAGLCAASSTTVGAGPHDLQPARRGTAANAGADRLEVEGAGVLRADAEERLDRGERHAALCAWCAPCSGRKMSSYSPPSPRSVSSWPPTAISRETTPNSMPSRATVASTSTACLQQTCGGLDRLLGQDDGGVLLDDAGLLPGDLLGRGAEPVGVVERDRGDHGDRAVDDVRRVPGAAHADLDDRDVDRRVGEGRVRHARQHLEEGEPVALLGVDHLDVRLDVLVRLDEALGGRSGAPSRLIRSVIDWTCGLV